MKKLASLAIAFTLAGAALVLPQGTPAEAASPAARAAKYDPMSRHAMTNFGLSEGPVATQRIALARKGGVVTETVYTVLYTPALGASLATQALAKTRAGQKTFTVSMKLKGRTVNLPCQGRTYKTSFSVGSARVNSVSYFTQVTLPGGKKTNALQNLDVTTFRG